MPDCRREQARHRRRGERRVGHCIGIRIEVATHRSPADRAGDRCPEECPRTYRDSSRRAARHAAGRRHRSSPFIDRSIASCVPSRSTMPVRPIAAPVRVVGSIGPSTRLAQLHAVFGDASGRKAACSTGRSSDGRLREELGLLEVPARPGNTEIGVGTETQIVAVRETRQTVVVRHHVTLFVGAAGGEDEVSSVRSYSSRP